MSGVTPVAPLNQVPNNPSLGDLLNLIKKELNFDFNCHHVGTVQSFNSVQQTITASINYTQTFYKLNETTSVFYPFQVNYPVLIDCPLIVLGGGRSALTFPVSKGDECLLLFNDRDIDNWFSSGNPSASNATGRLHSFSDAFALVGVHSLPNVLANYDSTAVCLLGNDSTLIKIANGVQNLNSLLQQLITAIGDITVNVPGAQTGGAGIISTAPINAATFTTIGTALGELLK